MWISKTEYNNLKFIEKEFDNKIREIHFKDIRINNLEVELSKKQAIITKMALEKELNSKIYEVKLMLSNDIVVTYNVKATSHDNAGEIALDLFCKNNKDFKKLDVKILETSIIGG